MLILAQGRGRRAVCQKCIMIPRLLPAVRPVSQAAALNGDCSGGLTRGPDGLAGAGGGISIAGGGHIISPS